MVARWRRKYSQELGGGGVGQGQHEGLGGTVVLRTSSMLNGCSFGVWFHGAYVDLDFV